MAWKEARLEGVTGDLGGPGEAEGDALAKSDEATFRGATGSSTSGRGSSPGSGGDGEPESESRLDMPESKLRLERLLVRAAVDMNGSRRRCFLPLPSLVGCC